MTSIDEQVRDAIRATPEPEAVPAWSTVTTRGRRIVRRRRVSRVTAALGVLALLVLGLAYVTRAGDTSSRSIVTNPGPATEQHVSVIPAGQYRYVKVVGTHTATVAANPSYTLLVPTTSELWVGADDSGRIRTDDGEATFLTPENEQAFQAAGVSLPAGFGTHTDRPQGPGQMHSLDLSTLPLDERELRTELNRRIHGNPTEANDPERLLEGLSDDLWLIYGPSRNWHALVSMLAATPGMDVTSRDGMTIMSAVAGGVRKELWFDANTGAVRRKRQVVVDATIPYALRAPNGTVLEDTTLEDERLVASTDETSKPDLHTVQLSPDEQVDWLTRHSESEAAHHLPGWRTELGAEAVKCDFTGVPGVDVGQFAGSASDFPLGEAITADRIVQECANGTDATRSAGVDLTGRGTLCTFTTSLPTPVGTVVATYPMVIFTGGSCEASGYESPPADFVATIEQQRRTEILLRAVPRECPTAAEARTWAERQIAALPDGWTVDVPDGYGCALLSVDWLTHTIT